MAIAIDPTTKVLAVGNKLTLTASGVTSGNKVVWKRPNDSTQETTSLEILSVTVGDGGEYTAEEKDANDTVVGSATATVTVFAVTVKEATLEVEEGKGFRFDAEITENGSKLTDTKAYEKAWATPAGAGEAASYSVDKAEKKHAGDYTATVTRDGASASAKGTLTVKDKAAGAEPPGVWDWKVALFGGIALLVVWAAFWVAWGGLDLGDAADLVKKDEAGFPGIVAAQLMIAGVFVALFGSYLALLQFRARQRAADRLNQAADQASGDESALAKVIEKGPELIEKFGSLRGPAQVLMLAGLMFVSATVLAFRALPDPAPAEDNKTSTITTQPTDQSVSDGETATFSVEVDLAEGDTVQWMKQASGGDAEEISGASEQTYTTPALTTNDSGTKYWVEVRKDGEKATESDKATLTVS